jgi:hypothetical protein
MKTAGGFALIGADVILVTIFRYGNFFCIGDLSAGGRRLVLKWMSTIVLTLLLGSGAMARAETPEAVKKAKNQCFCLINKALPPALREKPAHYGCRRVRTSTRHTPEIRCVNDGSGSIYSVEFDASKDFQAQFDEIADGDPRCSPCMPVIKARAGERVPRGDETEAADK